MTKELLLNVDTSLYKRKDDLIKYFRGRGNESLKEAVDTFSDSEYKKRAKKVNRSVIDTRNHLISVITQKAAREGWENDKKLKSILMTYYTSYISMIDLRNSVWEYEYMALSRRIGEIWEPFCKLCFEHSKNDLTLFTPPLFADVREKMSDEIKDYIVKLPLTKKQKEELSAYYDKVWSLVNSGEIKLELDLHFEQADSYYNIDFKSGFGSNEKGNTNRLLMVATVYKNLDPNYVCILLVRSAEELNNHYFQTLKNAGIWEAYCGEETYKKIEEFTAFDLKEWIDNNIDWAGDLDDNTMNHFTANQLDQYLEW